MEVVGVVAPVALAGTVLGTGVCITVVVAGVFAVVVGVVVLGDVAVVVVLVGWEWSFSRPSGSCSARSGCGFRGLWVSGLWVSWLWFSCQGQYGSALHRGWWWSWTSSSREPLAGWWGSSEMFGAWLAAW